MEKERRTVMLAALTLLMYGLVSVLGNGPFAFFPVNEIVFFAIAAYFSISNFKSAKISYVLILSFALLNLACNQLFLSFLLDNESITALFNSAFFQLIQIGSCLLMLIEITRFYILTKWKVAAFTYPLVLIAVVGGILLETSLYQVCGLVLFTGMLHYSYQKHETTVVGYSKSLFYLWYFATFLKLTTLLTIYLYGLKLD